MRAPSLPAIRASLAVMAVPQYIVPARYTTLFLLEKISCFNLLRLQPKHMQAGVHAWCNACTPGCCWAVRLTYCSQVPDQALTY